MRKKIFLELYLAAGVIALASCSNTSSWWNDGEYEYTTEVNDSMFDGQYMSAADARFLAENPGEAARVYNKRVPPLNSLIVCRAKQCAPAELSMSREYIFNALAHIVDNNLDATALLCEANPQAHVCTNPYLTVPAKVGVTPAYVFFDGVKVVGEPLGFCPNIKEYKANPDAYKGSVADACGILRVAITGRKNSPDLYTIMQLLGAEETLKRLKAAM